MDECSLKLKYLVELAAIVPTLGSEVFRVNDSPDQSSSTFTLVRVTAETGIQTSGPVDYRAGDLVRTRLICLLRFDHFSLCLHFQHGTISTFLHLRKLKPSIERLFSIVFLGVEALL